MVYLCSSHIKFRYKNLPYARRAVHERVGRRKEKKGFESLIHNTAKHRFSITNRNVEHPTRR